MLHMSQLNSQGALPSQIITEMVRAGTILGSEEKNIRPSSLDLSVSDEIYKVEGVFQPRPGETVREVLDQIKKENHSIDDPLLRDQMYIARLNEKLELPKSVYAFCNPKSTSGRIDTHVRLIADGVPRYDAISHGFSGELWVSLVPKTFPIKLYKGVTLNQLRFFTADTRLSELEIELALSSEKLLWNKKALSYEELSMKDNDGSLVLSLDLQNDILGYKGKKVDEVIDLSKIKEYDWRNFFEPIEKNGGGFVYLEQNAFYILSTLEAVRVPPSLACEMVPMDERSGEFRSHYAGFIDPGWGYGKEGNGEGRPLTLEVRPFEDIIVRNGQPIGKIKFERMTQLPREHYDELDSNYTVQTGPKLAKHFKQ